MNLRTMNDVRKWLLGVVNGGTPVGSVNYIEGRFGLAQQLLNLIGRDAAPDPWEAVADKMAERIRLLDSRYNGSSAGTLAYYRKMKKESREQGA